MSQLIQECLEIVLNLSKFFPMSFRKTIDQSYKWLICIHIINIKTIAITSLEIIPFVKWSSWIIRFIQLSLIKIWEFSFISITETQMYGTRYRDKLDTFHKSFIKHRVKLERKYTSKSVYYKTLYTYTLINDCLTQKYLSRLFPQ
jgi:hypothetical protein